MDVRDVGVIERCEHLCSTLETGESLGIIGEYLGRLHLNVNRKPQYVERQVQAEAADSPDPRGD